MIKGLSDFLNEQILDEGAWGYKPIESDAAMDLIDNVKKDYLKLISKHCKGFKDGYDAYNIIAVIEYMTKALGALDMNDVDLRSKEIRDCMKLYQEAVETCLNDESFMNSYSNPSELKTELEQRSRINSVEQLMKIYA